MSPVKDRFQEILLREKFITPADLDRALEEQRMFGGNLSKIIRKLGLVQDDNLALALSEAHHIPLISLARLKINKKVAQLIPKDFALRSHILPVAKIGDQLSVAMIDPLDIVVIDNVSALTGLVPHAFLVRGAELETVIEDLYSEEEPQNVESFDDIIEDIRADDMEVISTDGGGADGEVENLSQEAPIIRLANGIIKQSVIAKASDVFIEPMEKTMRIRYRVDGVIREIDRMSKVLHAPIISRIKVVSNLDISEHRLPQDGRFRTKIDEREVDFRVNVLPTPFGEKIVLRVLDKNLDRIDVEKLGFVPSSLQRLKECCNRPHGMILACGPTGSGKTTTLYSILRHIDSPGKNIVTVEDPVEYQMKGLNQVNVRPEVGLTFAASLRSILRQDPDVIMIGEIRDSDTLNIGVKAALTGHLVLSSLHTTTAAGSIIRMINMGIEPFLVCSSVLCIVAQRLIRRICPHCYEEYQLTEVMYERMNISRIIPGKNRTFSRGKGCDHCLHTGYRGRVGITEILVLTPAMRDLILSGGGEIDMKRLARREGMITMREDGLIKAADGQTSIEEVVRVTAPDEVVDDGNNS